MSLSDLSIQRPVATWMMTFAIVLFGVLGYSRLGVDQYPSMEFPIITVLAEREGASPEVMEEDVTDVLEEFLNTIPGLRNLTSRSLFGVSEVKVEFELGTDIDIAAQDVRDKLGLARLELPPDLEPPIVQKADTSDLPIIWLPVLSDRSVVDVTEYARLQLKPALQTIPGVGGVEVFGPVERNIRIWLDDEALRARGLSATDVVAAVQREHVEIPAGVVVGERIEYTLTTEAEFESIEALARLVVAHIDGATVRLADVARVEDGADDVRVTFYYSGKRSVGLGVLKQSGGNTVAIADQLYDRVDEFSKIAPSGMRLDRHAGMIDFSLPIREAVAETMFALMLGALLATLTVFVFLRRWRPTLIVGAAIPLSLIGSFGAMWILGFTLNVMTLLALALAVGVVIDDAIVVLENIERHRERGADAREAAHTGTREIVFAATAATLAIAVVFLPVAFASGIVGNFVREFGGTVASAVMISLFVALTLTPMLAARMAPPKQREAGSVYHRLERGFEWLEASYRSLLDWTLANRGWTVLIAIASLVASLGFASQLQTEFFPPEDQGRAIVRYELPPGTTEAASRELLSKIEDFVLGLPEITGAMSGTGLGGPDGPANVNQGLVFGILRPRNERERGAAEVMADMRSFVNSLPDANGQVFGMEQLSGADYEFEFDLRGNVSLAELNGLADQMISGLAERGGYVDLDKSLKLGLPELRVIPDREKAAALGVDAASIGAVLRATVGGQDIAKFKEGGHSIDVRVRLEEDARSSPGAIERLTVRAHDGTPVELRNLVRIETGAAASLITRTNRQRSVTVRANLQDKALGAAISESRELAARTLPQGITLRFSGNAESMVESGREFGLMLGLAVIVIYMVLAVQFESFVHPLTVMLALPFAMVGALGGILAAHSLGAPGMTINLFSLIGILLLFGLVTKNSILLVDYANQLRANGMHKVEAMRTAAPIRMRPVLMTAISMIFGVLPAALGLGPGAETRAPMGIATAAGMFSSTLLTLLAVPVFYLVIDDATEWTKAKLKRARVARATPSRSSS